MITNKRLGLHLLPLLVFAILGLGCSVSKTSPEAPVSQSTPPPKMEQKPESPPHQVETSAAQAPPPVPTATAIRPGIPSRYVVKKGDTLWDIAKHFLKDPWLWPQIWYVNPEIRNPHLIYPGDVIAMSWVKGKPVLTLEGAETAPPPPQLPPGSKLKVVKLAPHVGVEKIGKAITTLPRSAIEPFLYRPFFITADQLDNAPYIVSNYGGHVIVGKGARVFAKGIDNASVSEFNVVRKGMAYRNPETGQLLGYEAINLGVVRLIKLGDPQTLVVTKSYKEILSGDYLLPKKNKELSLNFYPRAPKNDIAGRIISVAGGITKIGQYNVVVIDKGSNDGLQQGDVLDIYQKGGTARDPHTGERVRLPEERAGVAMVFKTYKTISYALVMEAYRDLDVLDYVYSP